MNPKFWMSVTFVAFAFRTCAHADESTKAAKIDELMRLTNVESMTGKMGGQIRAMMMNQLNAAGLPEESNAGAAEMMNKVVAQVEERMSWDKLKPEYMKVYADVFSEEEITGIVAFYKTPIGHAMLDKMPLLMSKSMEISQRRMAGLMPEIQRQMQEVMQKSKGEKKP
jgi:uncharacterized protein